MLEFDIGLLVAAWLTGLAGGARLDLPDQRQAVFVVLGEGEFLTRLSALRETPGQQPRQHGRPHQGPTPLVSFSCAPHVAGPVSHSASSLR